MKKIIILFVLLALLVAGCVPTNTDNYRLVNNGEVTIISGEKYGRCTAGMQMTKLEVACTKGGHKTLVLLADSFEVIAQEPTE
jgi:PBP1b-binding outer membrane lipoprotein LpoB